MSTWFQWAQKSIKGVETAYGRSGETSRKQSGFSGDGKPIYLRIANNTSDNKFYTFERGKTIEHFTFNTGKTGKVIEAIKNN